MSHPRHSTENSSRIAGLGEEFSPQSALKSGWPVSARTTGPLQSFVLYTSHHSPGPAAEAAGGSLDGNGGTTAAAGRSSPAPTSAQAAFSSSSRHTRTCRSPSHSTATVTRSAAAATARTGRSRGM